MAGDPAANVRLEDGVVDGRKVAFEQGADDRVEGVMYHPINWYMASSAGPVARGPLPGRGWGVAVTASCQKKMRDRPSAGFHKPFRLGLPWPRLQGVKR